MPERVRESVGPRGPGRLGACCAAALLSALLLTGCAVPAGEFGAGASGSTATPVPTSSATPSSPAGAAPTAEPAPEAAVAALPRGEEPSRVSIPALNLDEELIDLGLAADGSLEVPQDFSRVGWFTGGGRPGGIGPTVIAGHVDSAVGPAVFAELTTLVPGDRFTITDVTGASFEYEVYRAEDFPKNAFPTAEVFGALPSDEVRLITCTGVFDHDIGHYDDNRVVFAAPVP